MQRSRHFLACSLVLLGLGLRFASEVRAQPTEPKPAAPTAAPPVDGGVADAAPGTDAAPVVSPADASPADAGAPETSPAPSAAPASPAPETGDAAGSGSGLFEQSLSGAAAAGEGAPAAEAGASPGYELGGYVRGDMWVGKIPDYQQPEMKAAYGELALKFNTRKEHYGDAFAEARLRYGLQDTEQRVFLDLREAYVNAYLGPVDLRLGQQIVVWGRADAFNPTNNISALDLRIRSPVEDDRRLGNVGVRAFLNFEPMRIEGVWMPLYVPAELPRGIVPAVVTFTDPDFPDPGLERSLGAVRVHLELPAFETSVSYLHGYAPLPGFVLSGFTTGPDAEVRVARTAYNHDVFGFDFSTALGEVLAVRGEAAYRKPADYQQKPYAPRPDLQYVLGVDRAFGSVNVIAQYMGRYVFDWQLAPDPAEPVSEQRLEDLPVDPGPLLEPEITEAITRELTKRNQILFSQRARVQHLATARIEWLTLQDTMSVSALGMMNFTTKEWLLFPKLGYKVSDAMSATFGAEIYAGPDDTLFGLIDAELSAAYAELKMSF